jgi:hypothetical protein
VNVRRTSVVPLLGFAKLFYAGHVNCWTHFVGATQMLTMAVVKAPIRHFRHDTISTPVFLSLPCVTCRSCSLM